jgi:hypothetical protein
LSGLSSQSPKEPQRFESLASEQYSALSACALVAVIDLVLDYGEALLMAVELLQQSSLTRPRLVLL